MTHHYAEIFVGDRVMHRFPCVSQKVAERCARAFITDLWPEDGSAECWSFHHSAFYGTNDLGETVMINVTSYSEKKRCGSYNIVLGGTSTWQS